MKASYWEESSFLSPVDLTIVGGGLTGLLSALHFIRRHPAKKVRILEKGPFSFGASTRNAGFACFGSPSEILEDLSIEGIDSTQQRLAWRIDGLNFYHKLFPSSVFDYAPTGGFEVFRNEDVYKFESIASQLSDINKLLRPFFTQDVFSVNTGLSRTGMNVHSKGFYNSKEGSLNPGKLCQALEKLLVESGVDLRHGVSVTEVVESNSHVELIDENGLLWKSETCLLATNGLTKSLIPELNIEPARGQVLLTEPIERLSLKGTFHLDEGYYYFRNVDNRLLLGGGRQIEVETERTMDRSISSSIQTHLQDILRTIVLPHHSFNIANTWAGTMSFGTRNEKTPVLKRLSERVMVAARLGGMGVAMAPSVAKEAIDLLED